MGNVKFSAGIWWIIWFCFCFAFLWTLRSGTDSWKMQLGSIVLLIIIFAFDWWTTLPNVAGIGRLRSAKVISTHDGTTCRLKNRRDVGAGYSMCTFIADKTIIPEEIRDKYSGFTGWLNLWGFYCEFTKKIKNEDLVPHPHDQTSTPENIFHYYGIGGLTGRGNFDRNEAREIQFKDLLYKQSLLADSTEKLRSVAENLIKSKQNELKEAGVVLNKLIKDTTEATSGSVQAMAEMNQRTQQPPMR